VTNKDIELYGRGKILRFVSDGLKPSRDRDTPPITLLIGPRGSGKSLLLDRLKADHRTSSPTARLDFGRSPDASPEAVMLDIGYQLSPGLPRVGKVRFPLLGIGLLAVSLDPESRSSPTEQLDQLVNNRGKVTGRMLANLGKQVGTLLPTPEYQSIATEVGAALGWIVDGINRHRVGDYLTWYANNVGRGNGTRVGPLLLMHEWWRAAHTPDGTAARGELLRALCAALLADLRDGFNRAGLMHGLRTTNCLLLLDNSDSDTGSEFLQTLAECRRLAPGEPDPLSVVAAQGRWPEVYPAVGPPILPADESLNYADWLTAAKRQETPGSPWYPVLLADLDTANATSMVTSHVLGAAWRDIDFVQDISGGSPFAVRELATQLNLAGTGFDPRRVLTRQLEDELLARLRPAWLGDRDLLAMAVFAATLRPTLRAAGSAFKSLRWTGVADGDADETYLNELDIRDLFLSLMWARDGGEDWLTVRPLPRLLLMRLLARDGALWDQTHEGYLAHYRTQAALDQVAEQYHLLAVTTLPSGGNVGKVATHLEKQFGAANPGEWNAVLTAITTAPNRLRQVSDGQHQEDGQPGFAGDPEEAVRRLAGVASPDDRLRTITRLVAARWLYNDRLFDPRRRLARLLDREYYELAQLTDGDSDVFYREVSGFRKIARNWEDR
jgi:hypothetical protein